MSEMESVAPCPALVAPCSPPPRALPYFSKVPEAASSAACLVVVSRQLVDVEIHRRPQSQYTGALGPQRGCPFNDRPSQGKERE